MPSYINERMIRNEHETQLASVMTEQEQFEIEEAAIWNALTEQEQAYLLGTRD